MSTSMMIRFPATAAVVFENDGRPGNEAENDLDWLVGKTTEPPAPKQSPSNDEGGVDGTKTDQPEGLWMSGKKTIDKRRVENDDDDDEEEEKQDEEEPGVAAITTKTRRWSIRKVARAADPLLYYAEEKADDESESEEDENDDDDVDVDDEESSNFNVPIDGRAVVQKIEILGKDDCNDDSDNIVFPDVLVAEERNDKDYCCDTEDDDDEDATSRTSTWLDEY